MNNCSFVGRFTADPELKTTQSNVPVCSFTLAVKRPRVKDTTDFINFVAWRNTAELIARYFSKGQMIAVSGVLTSDKYQDKDGNNRSKFEVVVDTVSFVESKSTALNVAMTEQAAEDDYNEVDINSEDLPF